MKKSPLLNAALPQVIASLGHNGMWPASRFSPRERANDHAADVSWPPAIFPSTPSVHGSLF
ncbi:MAG: hypothetical protein V4754_14270 [Pseudomonadota bacterium]